ncbi:MAG: glycosyl transferase, partial [Clostridia bacterium]|nr:glycosyl transferase [Clostridia bacterium]
MQEFSVLMSVYKNDVAENVITAVKSIIEQTVRPSQVVIVVDGPIP